MTEYKKHKKKKKFFPVLIVSVLLMYFVAQWYLINRNKIETVKANEGYINDSILSTGIVCREETIIENVADGYFYYNADNGQRVSAGMTIGEVYPSQNDIDNIITSQQLENRISDLEEADNFMYSVNVDISIIRKQLSNSMAEFSKQISVGNYGDVYNSVQDILLNLNKINVAMDREGDISGTKDVLNAQYNSIKGQVSSPVQTIYSPTSGYFMNDVDGYEYIADADNFKNISYEEGYDILINPMENSVNSYGKMITDYKWNLCTYVTAQQAERLYVGQRVRLSLNSQENEYHSVTVDSIVPKGDMVLIVLKSTTMNKQAAASRIVDGEILFSQYRGIKIPKSAIRIVDGEMGVYVKFSKLVIFKKVNPVYQDENYVILPLNVEEGNEVELYDDIIVKGVNLYDGKYL
ncbi:MAG: hypothetical protein IKA10_01810 [Oscillospiraceae bacterium]|nr:hypothetical protein [Oscillospiraceae bacterium]